MIHPATAPFRNLQTAQAHHEATQQRLSTVKDCPQYERHQEPMRDASGREQANARTERLQTPNEFLSRYPPILDVGHLDDTPQPDERE